MFPLKSGEIWPLSYYPRCTSACLNFNVTPDQTPVLPSWSSDASPGLRDTAARLATVPLQVNIIVEAGAVPSSQFCGHMEPPKSSKNSHSGARANFSTFSNNPFLKLQMG